MTQDLQYLLAVAADFLLRDSSENIGDRFNGWIQAIVIAIRITVV